MGSSEGRVFQTEAKKRLIISRNIKKISEAGGDKAKGRESGDEAWVTCRVRSNTVS